MNHDDNKPDTPMRIEPELEARIVAWISGEASAFEVAELERLTAEKPELAIFKRRIETVRGLVGEALRPDPQPLLLSPRRRADLLQAIGTPGNSAPTGTAPVSALQPLNEARRRDRKAARWIYAVAACLTVGFFMALSIPSFQLTRGYNAKPGPVMLELAGDGSHALEQSRKMEVESRAMADAVKRSDEADAMARRKAESFYYLRAKAPAGNPRDADSVSVHLPVAESVDFNMPVAGPEANAVAVAADSLPAFKVTAPAESGYFAANTLTGSRVNTNLKDIASDISVASKQFLADTGAMTANDSLSYSAAGKAEGAEKELAKDKERNWGFDDAAGVDQRVGGAARSRGLVDGIAAPQPTQASAPAAVTFDFFNAPAAAKPAPIAEDTLVLSPFEVASSRNEGYKAFRAIGAVGLKGRDALGLDLKKADEGKREADEPLSRPAKPVPAEVEAGVEEVSAAKEPVSTFSLHVSDASFRLAQAALARGEEPEADEIRPEEFYNAFNYGDPAPAVAEKVGCRIEQAAHPFMQQRNLVRIAMQVAATGRGAGQPLHLTVLLDTSGSMEREDRAAAVHKAVEVLTSLLGPNDRVTLVGFARQPTLLADELPGDKAAQLLEIIAGKPAEGGTNLEEALKLGGELAARHLDPAAQNRIVLLTDGAANLGNADPAQLAKMVESLRQRNISFDACGVGNSGIEDNVLEALTRKGGGRYYVLDGPEAADAGFARQLAGAFRPAAENVKVQVRFNPARVGNYRLIGFEKHRLNEADFRNDQVRAAALAAEEAAVALYQVEVLPEGEGELGEVYVRFRDVATGAMVERSWTLAYNPQVPAFDRASPAMQLTGVSALLAEKFRGGAAGDAVKLKDLAGIMQKLRTHYAQEQRVQELVTMYNQARQLSGE